MNIDTFFWRRNGRKCRVIYQAIRREPARIAFISRVWPGDRAVSRVLGGLQCGIRRIPSRLCNFRRRKNRPSQNSKTHEEPGRQPVCFSRNSGVSGPKLEKQTHRPQLISGLPGKWRDFDPLLAHGKCVMRQMGRPLKVFRWLLPRPRK